MSAVIKLKIKSLLLCLFVILFLAILLIFPSSASEGVKNGLNYSANLLLPSLFPFMVLSSFVIRSGFSEIIGKMFSPVIKFLFGLPKICSAAIILSFVSGFPVGAKCVQLLYNDKKITETQAQRMMLFCVCSGPAFLITAVGVIMLKNITVGIILYFSQVLSCIILGIISKYIYIPEKCVQKNINNESLSEKSEITDKNIISEFILSCSDGASSVISMTALVMIFSLFINVAEQNGAISFISDILTFLGMNRNISDVILPIMLEVTGACKKICNAGLPLWVVSFAVGFGGMCVHLQIFDILRNIKISKIRFILFRFVNAVISSVITYIICIFYNPVTYTFSTSENSSFALTYGSVAGTFALIFMSIIFLLSLEKPCFSFKKSFPRNENGC